MTAVAKHLAARGLVLRSGAARGADSAFEAGAGELKEIFLPWPGFNGSRSSFSSPPPHAFSLAARHHPAWDRCSPAAQKLHARNSCQVLGPDLKTPSSFVICWTPGGSGSGGTGQALRIADHHDVPSFDMGVFPDRASCIAALAEFVKPYLS
jgi:hypothetical protein